MELPQSAVQKFVQKFEDKLTCLQLMLKQTAEAQTVECPSCQNVTPLLPHNGVLGLQRAFLLINGLFDVLDILKVCSPTDTVTKQAASDVEGDTAEKQLTDKGVAEQRMYVSLPSPSLPTPSPSLLDGRNIPTGIQKNFKRAHEKQFDRIQSISDYNTKRLSSTLPISKKKIQESP